MRQFRTLPASLGALAILHEAMNSWSTSLPPTSKGSRTEFKLGIEPEGSPSHEEILRDYLLVSAQGLLIINSESQTAPFIFTFQANTGASTLVGPIVALGGLQRYFLGGTLPPV